MKYINWDKINVKIIDSENLSLVDKFEDSLTETIEKPIERNYSVIPELKNHQLDKVVNYIYKSIILHEEVINNNVHILENENINEDLELLLSCDDIGIIKVSMYIIIDYHINYKIENDLQNKLLKDLIKDYKELKSKEDERIITVKCISYFINCINRCSSIYI